MGMKNHELVPTPLICTIAGLSAGPGAAFKIINTLHRNKLIYHENKTCQTKATAAAAVVDVANAQCIANDGSSSNALTCCFAVFDACLCENR